MPMKEGENLNPDSFGKEQKQEKGAIVMLFGIPGSGKNFVGEIWERKLGFHMYDADVDYTPAMRETLREFAFGRRDVGLSDEQEDEYHTIMMDRMADLSSQHRRVLVVQWLHSEKHRQLIQERFPEAYFVQVETNTDIRLKRVRGRKEVPIEGTDPEFYVNEASRFEKIGVQHFTVTNNKDLDEENIIKQGESILREIEKNNKSS